MLHVCECWAARPSASIEKMTNKRRKEAYKEWVEDETEKWKLEHWFKFTHTHAHTRGRRGSRRNGETKNNRKSYLVDGVLRACWFFFSLFKRYSNFNFNMHRIYLYIGADGTTLCHCACRHSTIAKRIERATETDRPHNTTKSKAKIMICRYI